ncbi:MAG: PKD domain-containing protein [bacterium]|nr:PKD domain-containing protein [bacterium]
MFWASQLSLQFSLIGNVNRGIQPFETADYSAWEPTLFAPVNQQLATLIAAEQTNPASTAISTVIAQAATSTPGEAEQQNPGTTPTAPSPTETASTTTAEPSATSEATTTVTPTATASSTPTETVTATPTASATATATATHTATRTPTSTLTATPKPPNTVIVATATSSATPIPPITVIVATATPSATPIIISPAAPTANFSADPSTGTAPLAVNFTNLSSGVINSYLWDFSNGQTSTSAAPPQVTYTTAGTYTVTLTVSGPGGTVAFTRTIVVSAPPPPPISDVSLSKTASAASVVVGQNFTYTLTASNAGTANLAGVQITDTLPTGLTLVSAPGCTSAGNTVTCATASLAVGASAQHILTVQATTAGNITNTASVTFIGTDSNPADNTASAAITVQTPTVDLAVSQRALDRTGTTQITQHQVGGSVENYQYAFTVTNGSAFDATGVVLQHTHNLTSGSIIYLSGNGSYDAPSRTWTVGTVPAGGSATLRVMVSSARTNDPNLTNTLTLNRVDQTDTQNSNNTATVSIAYLANSMDVAVSGPSNPDPLVGQTFTRTIRFRNFRSFALTGVRVAYTPTPGITLLSAAPNHGTYDLSSDVWEVGTVDAAMVEFSAPRSVFITFTFRAEAGSEGQTLSSAVEITAADQTDSFLNDNRAVFSTRIQAITIADLSVEKQVNATSAYEGQSVTYTVIVENNGPSHATNVEIEDVLPTSMIYVSSTSSQGAYNSTTGRWTVGTINSGADARLTIIVTLKSGTGGETITNTARLLASTPVDTTTANNQDDVSLQALAPPQANLSISKFIVSGATPFVGEDVVFRITVGNGGPDNATGVQVTDMLPPGLRYASHTTTGGDYNPATGIWNVGNLPNGGNHELMLTAWVEDGTAGRPITNEATITRLDQNDPVSTNNRDFATVSVQPTPQIDLVVSQIVNNNTPAPGEEITFTVTVHNQGPLNANGVALTVEDNPDGSLNCVVAQASQGTYFAGTWTVGGLSNQATATLNVYCTVVAAANTDIVNTARLTASTPTDPNTGNNRADTTVQVRPAVDAELVITKTVDNSTPAVTENITYTIEVTSLGPDAAFNVLVDDVLPAGLNYIVASATAGTYDSATGDWLIPQIPLNGTVELSIVAEVDTTAGGQTITNRAEIISADQNDPNPANNVATVDILVDPITTLQLTALCSPEPVSFVRWRVRNANVMAVPFTWQYYGGTQNGAETAPSAAGATPGEIHFNTPGDPGTVTLQIFVGGVLHDTKSSPIFPCENDLRVEISVDNTAPLEGQTINYTVTLFNDDSQPGSGIQVMMNWPVNMTLVSSNPSQGTFTGGQWQVGTVVSGGRATLTLSGFPNPGTVGATITTEAQISAALQPDPVPANNSAQVAIVVQPPRADLNLSVVANNPTPAATEMIDIDATLLNEGPQPATGVSVRVTLPAGLDCMGVSTNQGTYDFATRIWTVGTLNVGTAPTFGLTCLVQAGTDGQSLPVLFEVTTSNEFDPDSADNTYPYTLNVEPAVDANLSIAQFAGNPTPMINEIVDLDVIVTNNGSDAAFNVQFEYLIPAGFTYESHTGIRGVYNPATGVMTIPHIPVGATAELYLRLIVNPDRQGQLLTSYARIIRADQVDGVPGDNETTLNIQVQP